MTRAFLGALLLLLAAAASATTYAHITLEELAARADVVVRARVGDGEARWLERAGPARIVTFHRVDVLEVLQGRLTDAEGAERSLTVGVPGGVVGEIGQRVHGAPKLASGDVVVIFLGPATGPGGARGVVGLEQGVLHVIGGRLTPHEGEGGGLPGVVPPPPTVDALKARLWPRERR